VVAGSDSSAGFFPLLHSTHRPAPIRQEPGDRLGLCLCLHAPLPARSLPPLQAGPAGILGVSGVSLYLLYSLIFTTPKGFWSALE
jgi:hypothetical protein